MRRKHDYSPNNKMVAGPHNFQESHTSAEPAGGGAQGPAPQMVAGAQQGFADGGYTGAPSAWENAKDSVSSTIGNYTDKFKSGKQAAQDATLRSGNKDETYEGSSGKAFNDTVDKAVADAGG